MRNIFVKSLFEQVAHEIDDGGGVAYPKVLAKPKKQQNPVPSVPKTTNNLGADT